MSASVVLVHRDAEVLAQAIAARLVTRLVDVQSSRGAASLVLTGGGIGTACLAALAASSARDAVDWERLDVWWGDERFVGSDSEDRNDLGAREALLDHVPVDPSRVHTMPALDGPDGDDLEAAAERYAAELAAAARPEDHGGPSFDILLLGVGPDAHIASLFPEMPALQDDRMVVPVRGAPKPPPTRLSLGMSAIRAADEVWLLASGPSKAGAVRLALAGGGEQQVPAAGARGRHRTLWLLDADAAAQIPTSLTRIASP